MRVRQVPCPQAPITHKWSIDTPALAKLRRILGTPRSARLLVDSPAANRFPPGYELVLTGCFQLRLQGGATNAEHAGGAAGTTSVPGVLNARPERHTRESVDHKKMSFRCWLVPGSDWWIPGPRPFCPRAAAPEFSICITSPNRPRAEPQAHPITQKHLCNNMAVSHSIGANYPPGTGELLSDHLCEWPTQRGPFKDVPSDRNQRGTGDHKREKWFDRTPDEHELMSLGGELTSRANQRKLKLSERTIYQKIREYDLLDKKKTVTALKAGEDRAILLGLTMILFSAMMYFVLGVTVMRSYSDSCGSDCRRASRYPCLQVFVSINASGRVARLSHNEETQETSSEAAVQAIVANVSERLTMRRQVPCHHDPGGGQEVVLLTRLYGRGNVMRSLLWPSCTLLGGALIILLVKLTQYLSALCEQISKVKR
ncbi:calcium-activated potassium channel subunit beta-2-like [Scleropages formosus]|uniref:Calcium-activated potassium channel subunit beta-2-like n=1 Tax=Scleropages formosus TaxID=113540 RepID=A0A0P7UYK9_SCLFO|nr:calcium-activated potassium channel subunit beta-2-like [Scleropages formosus]